MRISNLFRLAAMALLLGPGALSQAGEDDIQRIKSTLSGLLPDTQPDAITESPVPGLYEVVFGPQIFYVSADGQFLFQGDLFDIKKNVNLTEEKRNAGRLAALNGVGEERMIIFAPKQPKHTITVFTDIDCGYCRKLHSEMDAFNNHGIAVRYLLYPRAGVDSQSYEKAVSVWCADDRHKALTDAKAGKDIPKKTCDNPVRDHMELGRTVGVRGTPTIILSDGRKLPGYIPADRLSTMLDSMP